MKKLSRNYLVLVILLILFAAPGLVAYLFYTHPYWLQAASINKGTLLNPPLLTAGDGLAKWRLVLWNPGDCDKPCMMQMEKLARVRLALGRHLYEVDQWLLVGEGSHIAPALAALWAKQGIHVIMLSASDRIKLTVLPKESAVYIANPNNYLVLGYKTGAKPDDIFQDIKQLLATTTKSEVT